MDKDGQYAFFIKNRWAADLPWIYDGTYDHELALKRISHLKAHGNCCRLVVFDLDRGTKTYDWNKDSDNLAPVVREGAKT